MNTTSKRPQRTKLADRSVLKVKGQEPGYVYRIVNDVGDRISLLQEQGYEVVTDNAITIGDRRIGKASKDGSPVQVSVGGGVTGFLMRQKQEFYDEDQLYKRQQIEETERAMKKDSGADYGSLKIGST